MTPTRILTASALLLLLIGVVLTGKDLYSPKTAVNTGYMTGQGAQADEEFYSGGTVPVHVSRDVTSSEENVDFADWIARHLAVQAGLSDARGFPIETEAQAIKRLLQKIHAHFPDIPLRLRTRGGLVCTVAFRPEGGKNRKEGQDLIEGAEFSCLNSLAEELKAEKESDFQNIRFESEEIRDLRKVSGIFKFKSGEDRDLRKIEGLFKGCAVVSSASCDYNLPFQLPLPWEIEGTVDMEKTGDDKYELIFSHNFDGVKKPRFYRKKTKKFKVRRDAKKAEFLYAAPTEEVWEAPMGPS